MDTDFIENQLRKDMEGFKIPVAFFELPESQQAVIKPDRKALRDLAQKLLP